MSTLTVTTDTITVDYGRGNRSTYANNALGLAMAPAAVREHVERVTALTLLADQAHASTRKANGRRSLIGPTRFAARLAHDAWRVLPRRAKVAVTTYVGLGVVGWGAIAGLEVLLRSMFGLGFAEIFSIGLYYVASAT